MTVSDDELNTEIASWNDEKIKTLMITNHQRQHNLETFKE